MSFSATDAAFEGFRVVRRRPIVAVMWGLVYLVLLLAVFGLFADRWAGIMAAAEALERSSSPSEADIQALGFAYMGLLSWLVPLGLVFGAVLSAAVARAVLRPEESRWGYLRLGMDEVRVLVVSLVVSVIIGLASGVGLFAASALFGLGMAGGQAIWFLVAVIAALAAAALVVWLAVKLSLAVPITVDRRRIALGASFAATRGRFWPLLGMAVIAIVMSIIVSLLGGMITAAVELSVGGVRALGRLDGLPTGEILAQVWPGLLVWSVVNAFLSALQMAVIYAPFSAAWRDIRGLSASI